MGGLILAIFVSNYYVDDPRVVAFFFDLYVMIKNFVLPNITT